MATPAQLSFQKPSAQWAVWLFALAAALVLTGFALAGRYPPGDLTLARAVQDVRAPGLGFLSDAVYWSGMTPYFQLIAVAAAGALALRGHGTLALFTVVAALARVLAALIKDIVERPRPSPLLVDVSRHADGFSFPSGHVLGAVLLWGFLWFAAGRALPPGVARSSARALSAAVIVLMGVQRVYAGAHWPSDVLAAYLWGGVALFALVRACEAGRRDVGKA